MRRALRLTGTALIVAGVLTLGWAVLVWQWQDPFTAVYTHFQQSRLSHDFEQQVAAFQPPAHGPPVGEAQTTSSVASTKATDTAARASRAAVRREAAADARADRRSLHTGAAVGRLIVPRLGLRIVVVQGTDHESLKKGPGHYPGSYLPGQGKLVYIAGHRTTYLAPFSHIDRMRRGDRITLEMPYGTFTYVVTRHRIVPATDLSVLKSRGHEVLILQACHPRFFATHRYLVYARPAKIALRGGPSVALAPTLLAAGRDATAN